MKSTNYNLVRYDADNGKVFDYKDPKYNTDKEGNKVQRHLYVKTLFIGVADSIDNYIEVEAPKED